MEPFFMRKESKIIFNLAGKIFNYPNRVFNDFIIFRLFV